MNDFHSPMIPRFRRSRPAAASEPSENAVRVRKAWRQVLTAFARGVPTDEAGTPEYVLNPLPPVFRGVTQMPFNSLWDPSGMFPVLLVQSDFVLNFLTVGKRHLQFNLERSDDSALGFRLSSGPEDGVSAICPLLCHALVEATIEAQGQRTIVLDTLISRFEATAEYYVEGRQRPRASIVERMLAQRNR